MDAIEEYDPTVAETEVTPEMEEAGFRALEDSGITDECLESDRLLVAEIYRAMLAVAVSQQRTRLDSQHTKQTPR